MGDQNVEECPLGFAPILPDESDMEACGEAADGLKVQTTAQMNEVNEQYVFHALAHRSA